MKREFFLGDPHLIRSVFYKRVQVITEKRYSKGFSCGLQQASHHEVQPRELWQGPHASEKIPALTNTLTAGLWDPELKAQLNSAWASNPWKVQGVKCLLFEATMFPVICYAVIEN